MIHDTNIFILIFNNCNNPLRHRHIISKLIIKNCTTNEYKNTFKKKQFNASGKFN